MASRDVPGPSLFLLLTASGTLTMWSAGRIRIPTWRRVHVHGRAQHMGRFWRDVGLPVSDYGWHSGAGEPEDKEPLGKSKYHVLPLWRRLSTPLTGLRASSCDSNTVNKTSNTCIFYDITRGDNDVACAGSGRGSTILRNCFRPAGDTFGVLSTSNTTNSPAYTAKTAWDFTTGIGSVNARNLVMDWPTAPAPSSGKACNAALSTERFRAI